MARRYLTKKQKELVRASTNNRCCWCGKPFLEGENLQYDHTSPRANCLPDGTVCWIDPETREIKYIDADDIRNFTALHDECHKKKTNGISKATTLGSDRHAIAKSNHLLGLTQKHKRRKIPSRPMPGGRNSPYKVTMRQGTIKRKRH